MCSALPRTTECFDTLEIVSRLDSQRSEIIGSKHTELCSQKCRAEHKRMIPRLRCDTQRSRLSCRVPIVRPTKKLADRADSEVGAWLCCNTQKNMIMIRRQTAHHRRPLL